MGVAERVLHTYDITWGLGVAWRPPTRLLPGAPGGDPTDVLLWCTELPGRPRRTSWGWPAARD